MKKAWMAMVLGALLLGTMAGAVWARPKQMLAGNRKLAIGPAAFEPAFDGYDYQIITWEMGKDTAYMSTTGDYDEYVAPVVFPTLSPVTVKKITLIVNDMNETDRCRALLYRGNPDKMNAAEMAIVKSELSAPAPLRYSVDTIQNATVWPSHAPVVRLELRQNMKFYGVIIEYQVNS